MGDNDGGKEIIELVDSLFSVCALFNHIQTFSALERKQKPKRNSKRSIKQRCRLEGAEATAAAAAPPGLSHSWLEAISLGVESKTYRASLSICRGAGGQVFLKLKALLCLTTAAPFLLYTPSLAPDFLHSLSRSGSGSILELMLRL